MTTDAKVRLQREKTPTRYPWNPDMRADNLSMCLPFYRSKFGARVHRVRSGANHFFKGDYTHTHLHLWCGGNGFIGPVKRRGTRGEIMADAPEHCVFCAVCEGKAIGAGMDGARIINGRHVIFSPRT